MKKIYTAPSTFSIELRTAKMMMLNLSDQKPIDSKNMDDFDQNAREENIDNNRGSIWDNAW